jgi:uncharacterized protein involved in exopolysaccharide biosynthesis
MKNNEINLEKVFLILRARANLVFAVFITVVVISGVITYLSPKMYRAMSSLNFEFTTNPVDTRGRVLSDETYLSTQIDIIKSLSVAQEVEKNLTEYEKARLDAAQDAEVSFFDKYYYKVKSSIKSLFRGNNKSVSGGNSGNETIGVRSAYTSFVRRMGSGLVVQPRINSRIVDISYMSADPKIAALMANRYADAYIVTSVRMITDPAQKSKIWFDVQLKSLRKRLEDAQAMLTDYQQKEGIVSSDEHYDFETERMQNLADQLVVAQHATRNAVTEQKKLEEVIDSGDSLMTFRPVFDDPTVQKIKSEIRDLKGSIAEKSSNLGRNHPDMKKLYSELYSTQKRLDSEIADIVDGINNAAELSRERELDLEASLKRQKAIVLDLKSQRDKIAVLKREVDSAKATYNAALEQLNTTSMQSRVDQTNVSIIDAANIPSSPAKPKVMLNLAIGIFGGLLAGVGLALFLELIIRQVHTKEELIEELEIPLLGHLRNV